jgi:hypothetical protein
MSNLLELPCGASPGKMQRPSQDHWSWPQTITNMCQTSTVAPSHLGGGNHQEKQTAKDHPSATKMQTHKYNVLGSLNLTLDYQPSKGDEWKGVCSAQEDIKMIKSLRGFPKGWPTHIYRGPKGIELLGSHSSTP